MSGRSPSLDESFSLSSPTQVGGREKNDHYPTPLWTTEAIYPVLTPLRGPRVFDPTSGEGAILDVFRARGWETLGIELQQNLARQACGKGHRVECGDSLAGDWPDADLLCGNPPYKIATEFGFKAARWAQQRQRVAAMLLRITFLEPTPSNRRRQLMQEYPCDLYILPDRPAFLGPNKGGDSTTSAWFVWPGERRFFYLPSLEEQRLLYAVDAA